ncbi:MAG: hypothetical protein ABIR32_10125 [Ilumatobacteraceae bacterium]
MTTDLQPLDVPAWLSAIGAGTEMGDLIQAFDWASTPLGPSANWSVGLKLALGICLTSRFPILVTWGPDLIEFYNDAYRPILGSEKHSSSKPPNTWSSAVDWRRSQHWWRRWSKSTRSPTCVFVLQLR